MKGLKWMILITHREYQDDYVSFLREHEIERVFTKFCHGTAPITALNLLGLEATDKIMIECAVRDEHYLQLKHDIEYNTNLSERGNGVCAFINVGAMGGEFSLKSLVGEKPVKALDGGEIMNNEQFCLIITIVERGNVDSVMDAARGVGAKGGTVVNAKGTGAEMAKFFGLTISEDKDMIYIISKRDTRDVIMKAIMEKAGANTDAHGVVFSLPLDGVMGIKAFENNTDNA